MRINFPKKKPLRIVKIDVWYDRHIKSWIIQRKTKEGFQVGKTYHVYKREEALKIEKELRKKKKYLLKKGVE